MSIASARGQRILARCRETFLFIVLCICAVFIGTGIAKSQTQGRRSIEVIEDRADRVEVRLSAMEQVMASRTERLARIEENVDTQSKILWAVLVAALGLVVDRMAAVLKSKEAGS